MRGYWLAVWLVAGVAPLAPAAAWNEPGHQVVAQIAYTYLHPGVRARAAGLLKEHPDARVRDFIQASTWADTVRREQGKYASWHFINLPYVQGGGAPSAGPERENVVRALNVCIATLRSREAGRAEQAEKLSLLVHLVGDIHQPLHCINRFSRAHPVGDRGGGLFPIRDVSSSPNLHAFWDNGLGQWERIQPQFMEGDADPLEQYALEVISDFPRSVLVERATTDFRKWAEESHTLARSYAYAGLKEGASPPAEYVARARPVARKRLALAGYRLADLLNRLYPED
jgi:hypothetical protein